MRLLITSDLHFNHPGSRPVAEDLIRKINRTGGDALVLVGDTAVLADQQLEQALSRIHFKGERLFVAGNHELWTHGDDSYRLFKDELPRRVRELGWRWLQDEPFLIDDDRAIVGSVGWYDYSFAPQSLGIPRRFYAAKISPGAAERLDEFHSLFENSSDIPEHARQVVARWNDGKFVKLHRSDEEFLGELLEQLRGQLEELRNRKRVLAMIHHLPFGELLPPPKSAQWDFAKAFLGSPKIGKLLLQYENISDVYCGHSHFAASAQVRHIQAINPGCGYRHKTLRGIDV
jgi:predicted phosphodiesterase